MAVTYQQIIADPRVAARRAQYLPLIQQAAAAEGLPWQVLDAIVARESRYNPQAVGGAGERGLGQLMPGTAAMLGVDWNTAFDPAKNLRGAAKYASQAFKMSGGDPRKTAIGYNAGLGRIKTGTSHPGALAYGDYLAQAIGGGQMPASPAAVAGGGMAAPVALDFAAAAPAQALPAPAAPGYLQGAKPTRPPADTGLLTLAELMRYADYQSPYSGPFGGNS